MDSIIFALWFFLPAGLANAAPIIAAHLPGLSRLNAPIDGGKSYAGKRIFGAHKTWRGLLSGIIVAISVVYVQQLAYQSSAIELMSVTSLGYLVYSPILLGFLFGFGALMGDAIESCIKRQRGIDSGESWFPFDQIDYIVGGCLAVAIIVRLHPIEYALVLIIWFGMHMVFSYVGFLLKLKSQPI